MADVTVKKKGFRTIAFNEHWTEGPAGTWTSTNNKALIEIEWGKDDGQTHGDSEDGTCKPMKIGSTVVITEGDPDDRATIVRNV